MPSDAPWTVSWKAAESQGSGLTCFGGTTRPLLPLTAPLTLLEMEQEIPPGTCWPPDTVLWSRPKAGTSSLPCHSKGCASIPARTLLLSALGLYPQARLRLLSSSLCWLAAEL